MTTIPEEAKEAAARALCRHGTGFPTIEQTLAYVDQKWPRFKEEAEIALTAALPHLPGVGVKKLEWELVSGDHYAEGAGIHYNIYETGPDWWNCVTVKPGNVRLATNVCLDAAKAAAQADYEARILSALEPSAARELALEEAFKAGAEWADECGSGESPYLETAAKEYAIRALSSPDHADAGKVEGDGWLPIESAPKDEPYLAFEPHGMGGFMFVACMGTDGQIRETMMGSPMKPTHWRPLPSAPSQEVAGS